MSSVTAVNDERLQDSTALPVWDLKLFKYLIFIFQYISNKMQLYTVYLYLETALHVSGGTSTHNRGGDGVPTPRR